MSIPQQQQVQFEAAHLKMMEFMMRQFSLHFPDPKSSGKQSTSADAVPACITEFIYDPDSDDLFAKLNGGTCFAKLNLSDTFHQIEVGEESRELLAINTHRGLFQFTHLQFGVKTAPATFQQTMDTMLTGTKGTAAYLDDIIETGSNPDALLQRLETVLSRVQDYGFRLHLDRCNFSGLLCNTSRS
ncbi:unnamed protein product [Schistocephalus solidus]|uniref:Reverse transcriptase domain-containing protein n=1 Tax=Schistocephalus solidus TaxID=70667 RepID=A0A183T736_SCHSO|nr:unnamed protein product [Schistocephalus solidus]